MILVGQYDSPFVRRVAVTLNLYGLPFERRPLSVFKDFDAVLQRGAWIMGGDAATPTLFGIRQCGHSSGVRAPAFG